jgi:hypothetical protein
METTRRRFIRYVGVMIASLLSSRCQGSCYIQTVVVPRTPDLDAILNEPWAMLRDCWLELDHPALKTIGDTDFTRTLRQRHTEALEGLVASGEMEAAVADEIEIAFEEVILHRQGQMSTCYIALPPEFVPREDLLRQIEILEEIEATGEIEATTLARARAAIERDMAWLSAVPAWRIPGELEEVESDPVSVEAARILVELLISEEGVWGDW